MHIGIYDRLLEIARAEDLTTYSQIAPLAGLTMSNERDRDAISDILVEIAKHEQAAERPMLTALVVHYVMTTTLGKAFLQSLRSWGAMPAREISLSAFGSG